MAITNVDKATLGDLLGGVGKRLEVPDYQRSYSWGKSNAEDLYGDLTHFLGANGDDEAAEYFLGALICVPGRRGKVIRLIDGQQRTATLVILLAAIRDALRDLDADDAETLHRTYLQDAAKGDKPPIDKVSLGAYDREFFGRHVLQAIPHSFPQKREKASHARIAEVADLFRRKMEEALARAEDDATKKALLESWEDLVTDQVVFVRVDADSEDDATDVFESLNDRGVGLSTLDLVRNFLLGRAAGDVTAQAAIVQDWSDVFDVSENASQLEAFLRHYWISHYGDVKSRGLYREIKRTLTTVFTNGSATPRTFSLDLSQAADHYAELLANDTSDPAFAAVLAGVSDCGAQALYPALLAASESLGEKAATPIAATLLSFYVRWSVIARRESTILERHVFALARALRGKTSEWEPLLKSIRQLPEVSDRAFRSAFANASLSNASQRRYVLTALELQLRRAAELTETTPDLGVLHVEHVYPQKPNGKPLADHIGLINRIGNLTLLHGSRNTSVKNNDFKTKKLPVFKKSDLLLNDWIAEQSTWGKAQIQRRQKLLAVVAPDAWPLAPGEN